MKKDQAEEVRVVALLGRLLVPDFNQGFLGTGSSPTSIQRPQRDPFFACESEYLFLTIVDTKNFEYFWDISGPVGRIGHKRGVNTQPTRCRPHEIFIYTRYYSSVFQHLRLHGHGHDGCRNWTPLLSDKITTVSLIPTEPCLGPLIKS